MSKSGRYRRGAAHRDDWDQHWDNYAGAAERNPAQRYRRRVVLGLLEAHGTPRRLLDIGSGQGDSWRLPRAAGRSAELLGIE